MRRVRNQAAQTKMKTLIKKVHTAEEKATAEVVLKDAVSFIDKSVTKGRLHKNTAARKKSSLTRHVNNLEA